MKTKSTVLSLGSLLAALAFILLIVTPVLALPPVINNQTLTIPENSPDGTFTDPSTLVAFDKEGKPITFDIIGGDGETLFELGFMTGQVSVINGSQLDYETKSSYTLVVKVEDDEALSDSAVITINLIDESDEPPSLDDGQVFDVPENTPNNTPVGQLDFDDVDVNDTHTFTIKSGNGTGLGAFQINSTGLISVKDTSQLNHEATPQFVLTVEIEDEGGKKDTADITINVDDVNENPVVNDTPFTISEAAANGAVVGTVTATDPDGGALNFTRTGTTAFNIGLTTGQVTVADSTQLDYETDPTISFVVTVTDTGGRRLTSQIIMVS